MSLIFTPEDLEEMSTTLATGELPGEPPAPTELAITYERPKGQVRPAALVLWGVALIGAWWAVEYVGARI